MIMRPMQMWPLKDTTTLSLLSDTITTRYRYSVLSFDHTVTWGYGYADTTFGCSHEKMWPLKDTTFRWSHLEILLSVMRSWRCGHSEIRLSIMLSCKFSTQRYSLRPFQDTTMQRYNFVYVALFHSVWGCVWVWSFNHEQAILNR